MLNSKCWIAVPSGRPVAEAAATYLRWVARGYTSLALFRDEQDGLPEILKASGATVLTLVGKYPGYAPALNYLSKAVLSQDKSAEWLVAANDDTLPDPDNEPSTICSSLTQHFGGTFGVCQPTGCRWAGGSIDDIAGSPWMGREWCRRAHAGQGPMCPVFFHMEVDVALLWAAEREGVYLRRKDLTHRHEHFCRSGEEVTWGNAVPPHLVRANSDPEKIRARKLLEEFKRDYDRIWRPLPAR